MKRVFLFLFICYKSLSQNSYYPNKIWSEKSPESQGLISEKIDSAIKFATENENSV